MYLVSDDPMYDASDIRDMRLVSGRYATLLDADNIRKLGAKGDGASDDTLAFQGAAKAGLPCLYVPEGVYVLSDTIRFTSPVRLVGAGSNLSVLRTELDLPVQVDKAKLILCGSDTLIAHLGFRLHNPGDYAIGVYHGSHDVTVTRCHAISGALVQANADKWLTVRPDGAEITGSMCERITVSHNRCDSFGDGTEKKPSAQAAINLKYCSNSTVEGNMIDNALLKWSGIQWWGGDADPKKYDPALPVDSAQLARSVPKPCHDIRIVRNTVRNCGGSGIWGTWTRGVLVEGNTVSDCWDNNIGNEGNDRMTTVNNRVMSTNGVCCYAVAWRVDEQIVANNTFEGGGDRPCTFMVSFSNPLPWDSSCPTGVLEGNTFVSTGSANWSLEIGDSLNLHMISGNTFRDSCLRLACDTPSMGVSIHDNVFLYQRHYGPLSDTWYPSNQDGHPSTHAYAILEIGSARGGRVSVKGNRIVDNAARTDSMPCILVAPLYGDDTRDAATDNQIVLEGNIVRNALPAAQSGPAYALLTKSDGGVKSVLVEGNVADVHGPAVYQWVDHVADKPNSAKTSEVVYQMGFNRKANHRDPYWMSYASVKKEYAHMANCLIPINNSTTGSGQGALDYNLVWISWQRTTFKIPLTMI
ncbi:right-handed parallel beta-helix repeat-containing protein [Bifidobacterium scardovii]|nr:right-handed parallel beta-helix repeat-containing protein [Bifidobacterium scardovii]BAQ30514.1 hypothetical protein BBSC_0434 [Bifidobacterium scardovii JCM 12489 = DSM 13734]